MNLNRRGQRRLQLRQQLLDPVDHADDVRPRLALDVDDNGRSLIHPGREPRIFRAVDHVGHIAQAHRCSVVISDDDRLVLLSGEKLVVGTDGVGLARAIDDAFRLVHIGLGQCRAHILEAQSEGSE